MTDQYVVKLGGLRLGKYRHRENAGRRALAVRRNSPGWRKLRKPGTWKNRKTKQILKWRSERGA